MRPPIAAASTNPLDQLPMRARQIWVLVLALLLAALDGYDVLSMAFVAPVIGTEWHVSKDAIGLLLSSSLIGMAVGALGLAPTADVLGRRKVILGALILMIGGSALCAYAPSVPMLVGARGITGVGIGLMIAMTTLVSAEFTNVRRRTLAVAAVATLGTPIGSIIGGLAASALLKSASWHWVFLTGALFGIGLFILVFLLLPETPAFLIARRSPNALELTNRVLAGIGQPAMSELPAATRRPPGLYRPLFAPALRGPVLRLMAIGVLIANSSYYILSWLPQIVVDAGFTAAKGSLVSALAGLVGLVGGVGFAAFSTRFPPTRLAATAMVGAALGLTAVGLVPPIIVLFVVSAGAIGFCLAGTAGLLYSIAADTFPAAVRASGVGLVMGASRIGSSLGPALAGAMFKHGMSRAEVSIIFAIGPVIAALLMGTLRHRSADAA